MPFQRVPLTTETIMRDKKEFLVPELDKDRIMLGSDGTFKSEPPPKIDRNFKYRVGNKEPITV